MRNVTIDNTNTTAIAYYPPLCNGTGWTQNSNSLAYNGTYSSCPGSNHARAIFEFTGVAIYYTCPLFSTQETQFVVLDDRPFEVMNLTSPTGDSIASTVVWSATGLENQQHHLELWPGNYNGGYGYVSIDAFIVTESDQPPEELSFVGGTNSDADNTPIFVGLSVGLGVSILAVLGLHFFLRKLRKEEVAFDNGIEQPFLPQGPTPNSLPISTSYTPYDPTALYRRSTGNVQDPSPDQQ
ncbi:hypothetical protein BDN72DRAFT_212678 [Pluteus cervinus]|uniref:Uncharacterized protein n=1 Tax=Pluteus cervinus TaxID=181527 RepID=A0ACD3B4H8_9AGAR|nr:hypothetical protein BDN72DRAFT_212678 [Pluteus cervinus]